MWASGRAGRWVVEWLWEIGMKIKEVRGGGELKLFYARFNMVRFAINAEENDKHDETGTSATPERFI